MDTIYQRAEVEEKGKFHSENSNPSHDQSGSAVSGSIDGSLEEIDRWYQSSCHYSIEHVQSRFGSIEKTRAASQGRYGQEEKTVIHK